MDDPYERFINKDITSSPCLFTLIKGKRVTWELTGTCNLGCKHCCVSASKFSKFKPNLERYNQIVDELVKLNVKALYISGGEPLLWDEFPKFSIYAKNAGIKLISLATNATLLTKEKIKELNSSVDKILVSLDHFSPKYHNKLRGSKNAFSSTIKGIKNLKKYSNIYIRVGCVIWKENYKHLERFIKFCVNLGVNEIAFSWIMKVGQAIRFPEVFPPRAAYHEVGKKLEYLKTKYSAKIKISFHRFKKFNKNAVSCKGGQNFYYINHRGKVGPCSWISKLFPKFLSKATIFQTTFKSLIKEKTIKDFLKEEEKRYQTYGPGCPAVCYIENGKFQSRDPLLEIN